MRFKFGGENNSGTGQSFRGALRYYLHDKRPEGEEKGPQPDTSDRVGVVVMENLASRDPNEAWREMVNLCNVAPILQREAAEREGKVYRARKPIKDPVFTYALSWHEDDRISAAEMVEHARASVAALGLADHQYLIIEHLPEPRKEGGYTKPHVHVCINRINPETGRAVDPHQSQRKLNDLCVAFEIERGIIRSPKEYAKHIAHLGKTAKRRAAEIIARLGDEHTRALAAAEQNEKDGIKHQDREEWKASQKVSRGDDARKAATAIKRKSAEEYRRQRTERDQLKERQRGEFNATWKNYQQRRAEIMAAYAPQMDKVWKRRDRGRLSALHRMAAFWNDPARALRERRDRQEWRRLGQRQWRERNRFLYNERSLSGRISNAIRAARVTDGQQGRLAGAFTFMRDVDARRAAFENMQEQAKASLKHRQNARKKEMAEPIRAARQAALEQLQQDFDNERDALKNAHAKQWAEMNLAAAAQRLAKKNAWDAWREQFQIKPRAPRDAFTTAAQPHSKDEQKKRQRGPRPDYDAGVQGVLTGSGSAPYGRDGTGKPSPYADLRLDDGRTVRLWGATVPQALKQSGATLGDRVTMQRGAPETVTIKKPTKDPETGRKVWTEKQIERRAWSATVERAPAPPPIQQPAQSPDVWKKGGPRRAPTPNPQTSRKDFDRARDGTPPPTPAEPPARQEDGQTPSLQQRFLDALRGTDRSTDTDRGRDRDRGGPRRPSNKKPSTPPKR